MILARGFAAVILTNLEGGGILGLATGTQYPRC
jgi:hypothetical protein